ncbi:MAG: phenylalanine--tRNA ligase subunit beta, partial [Thiotrichaceae bacterium]|nr:phenylalanine--tRNA ligase subunit beta [Thiotrichaceae bacterium]
GEPSHGMLCSAKELGLEDNVDGLMSLASDAPVGQDIRDYLNLNDTSIDIDITPNRGDCLSIAGFARELGLLTRQDVSAVEIPQIPAQINDTLPVEILSPEANPRYVGRVIKNVNVKAKTPLWMQEKLRRSDIRSISPVVDITNYVLLELGQPMHAFDLNKLSGGIKVRMAQAGEKLTLLDEQEIELDENTLVIADHQKALALAGVMGGLDSSVTDDTVDIFLESAFFTPKNLAGCARRYGLHTDSSFRFERGVDFQLQRKAIERATALLLDITGGQAGEVIEVVSEADLPSTPSIELRSSRIKKILGLGFPTTEVTDILQRLGMNITQKGDNWTVQPPSFRFDMAIEVDLIEDIARIHGYDNIPSRPPQASLNLSKQPELNIRQLQAALTQNGYQEAITYSFVDPELQQKVNPKAGAIALANPIASDMAVMRTNLWTGLLQALQYNQKRQQSRIRLFETGLRFIKTGDDLLQQPCISGVACGSRYPEQWDVKHQAIDFYDVKADIEALLQLAGIPYHFKPAEHEALHPGQTAAIFQNEKQIGLVGALNPQLITELDLIAPVFLFELQLDDVLAKQVTKFSAISKYPSVRRDLSLLISQQVTWKNLLDCVWKNAPEILIDAQLFDVYEGKGIELGKKSLAMGLIFQAFSRNLTESEVDEVISKLLVTFEDRLNAELRK